ncbi:hypothetical protein CNYM01_02357 [Colletotrichum nymphaeae SA-01]|uniref:Uncharacterized protein n=1 Tax=Colletotrichum nymphaeae SA-01 TaxID=1460502 RepID=A0A135UNU5_9PEZI|nr:hypothetical protein CNYM01_02357 [Colletotrichum nymphaeae SA-01]
MNKPATERSQSHAFSEGGMSEEYINTSFFTRQSPFETAGNEVAVEAHKAEQMVPRLFQIINPRDPNMLMYLPQTQPTPSRWAQAQNTTKTKTPRPSARKATCLLQQDIPYRELDRQKSSIK